MLRSLAVLCFTACAVPEGEPAAQTRLKLELDDRARDFELAVNTLCDAAPAPVIGGWTDDEASIAEMRARWLDAHAAYERLPPALVEILLPDAAEVLDSRYEDFAETQRDRDLFDRDVVVGVHAVERILWAGEHPPEVLAFESSLERYWEAALPLSEEAAALFRDELCARLRADAGAMRATFAAGAPEVAVVPHAMRLDLEAQLTTVQLAGTGEEESRYSQSALADLRANLEGVHALYLALAPWLRTVDEALDARVEAGFARWAAALDAVDGIALPDVPAEWNADAPEVSSSYGQLHEALRAELESDDALAADLDEVARALALPIVP
jgi:iron uptake system component EfeO